MNHFGSRGSGATAIALVALLISALVPATVAAAAPPVTLSVYMGDQCLSGKASAISPVEITWKDAYGYSKLHTTVASDGAGRFGVCVASQWVRVNTGDWISAKDLDTGISHLLIVPRLTGFGNRDLDLYKGTGPAGAYLRLICAFSNFAPCPAMGRVHVNSQGKWSLNPGWNVGGGESLIVQWKNASGDFVRTIATPPYLTVRIGSPRVVGEARRSSHLIVVVKRGSAMDVKATAELVANDVDGAFAGPVRNSTGGKVNVKPGDWITSDMSSEIDWIVPNISVVADSSTGHVTGECGTESTVAVMVYRNGELYSSDWYWPESGSFDFDSADGNVPFQGGDQVLIRCEVAAGDWVEKMTTAT